MQRVSILVPIYGVEKYIEKCAISLFSQTYENIEYIFVNDCTKDKSINILKTTLGRYPNRQSQVKIIDHEYNQGVAAARNTAVDSVTGEYFMFVDSDDYIETNAVELLVKKAEEDKADITICDYYLVYGGNHYKKHHYYSDDRIDFVHIMLRRNAEPALWGRLYKSVFYKKAGIRFTENLDYGEDFCVITQLIYLSEKISKISVPLYYYVQQNENSLTKNITKKSIDSLIAIDEVLDDFFEDKPIFKDSLAISKLRNKLSLIKMSNIGMYHYIVPLYKDIEKQYTKKLILLDRIIVYLCRAKLYYITYLYCKIGTFIKSRIS